MAGRFAPSPTGELHLGNLRTALVAWLAARATDREFLVRMEDLDQANSKRRYETIQLQALAALGLDWDGAVIRQSDRFETYNAIIQTLTQHGDVYPCYCTRREIRAEIDNAARAPHEHLPDGAYPGICRDLTAAEQARRAEQAAESGRQPALRLRTHAELIEVDDRLAGGYRGRVDDIVLARADGTPAYNLAVVVDDHLQGVTQVVRGDDLLSSTPRHLLLYRLLGWETPEYWHVPLVMVDATTRLAKRDGPVTLDALTANGIKPTAVLSALAHSLGLAKPHESVTATMLIGRFAPDIIPTTPILLTSLWPS